MSGAVPVPVKDPEFLMFRNSPVLMGLFVALSSGPASVTVLRDSRRKLPPVTVSVVVIPKESVKVVVAVPAMVRGLPLVPAS